MASNAEPLALIKDLLRLGGEVSAKVGEYNSVASNVLPSVISTADELGALRSILSELEDNFRDYPNLTQVFPHDALNDLRLVLTSCKKVFAQLRTAMHKFLGLERGGAFAKMFMSWRISYAEKDLTKIQRALTSYKATLNITLLLTKSFISQGNSKNTSDLMGIFREKARLAELECPDDVDVAFSDISDQSSQILTPHTDGLSELDSTSVEPTRSLPSAPSYQMPAQPVVEPGKERPPVSLPNPEVAKPAPQAEISLPTRTREPTATRFIAPIQDKDHKPKPAVTATDTDRTLIEAARTGDIEMMDMMLMLEPDINAHLKGTGTALSAAVMSRKTEAVQLLLDKGADPNIAGTDFSPLKRAVEYRQDAIGLLLLQHGADPNLAENSHTALLLAALDNRVDLMAAMIKHGADVNLRQGNFSVLSMAAMHGRFEIVRLLVDNGADVNIRDADGTFPLFNTATHGRATSAEILLDTPGIDVNMQTNGGATAMMEAAKGGHVQVIEVLLKHGADANMVDKRMGNSALAWACSEGKAQRYTDSVKALLAVPGIELNRKNTAEGATPLRHAATRGHTTALQLLLEAGADADIEDTFTNTPLIWAASNGHVDSVQALLDSPGVLAKIDKPNNKGANALYHAATAGHEKVVTLLLERGADPNFKGGADGSVLMAAVKARRTAVVKALMAAGAKK